MKATFVGGPFDRGTTDVPEGFDRVQTGKAVHVVDDDDGQTIVFDGEGFYELVGDLLLWRGDMSK